MIYIEYIQRDPGVNYEIFTFLGDQSWWAGADKDGDDDMVAQLGRTLRLGPDPGGIAIWTFPDFASLESIARQHPVDTPCSITAVGTYRRWGEETL